MEKNKDLEQFVYIASHDLQEPLSTISSISKMLSTEYRDTLDENGQSYIDFISGSVSRMHLLVKDLMDHSRLGKEFKFYHIDTNEIVNQIQKDLSKKIKESKTTIIVEDLPDIFGNEAIIRQLFQNLLTNAIKFREKDIHPIITIKGGENKTHWQFSVSDNGIGIKKKDRIKIFKIFHRLHRHEVYKGTGIGLANCKKIVEIHHGKIWVTPNESRGCTFIFTINKKLNNENSKISNANR
ncbi:ATP-binding protein [uncultured Kriegella sp.]|uniref:sensor histidine kinase n=1 Tax=uncultured Kriegella sp. TaxID=1798910 RepID=UPI0030DB9652